MNKQQEALRLALEALEVATTPLAKDRQEVLRARAAIREALAQPEQEPVACVGTNGELMWLNKSKVIYSKPIPLYTTPPQRTWEELTQQDIDIAFDDTQEGGGFDDFARAIEATLKRKNT